MIVLSFLAVQYYMIVFSCCTVLYDGIFMLYIIVWLSFHAVQYCISNEKNKQTAIHSLVDAILLHLNNITENSNYLIS